MHNLNYKTFKQRLFTDYRPCLQIKGLVQKLQAFYIYYKSCIHCITLPDRVQVLDKTNAYMFDPIYWNNLEGKYFVCKNIFNLPDFEFVINMLA